MSQCQVKINGFVHLIDTTAKYEDIVAKAGLTGNPSMTYRKAKYDRSGILSPGQTVEATAETIFNVSHTNDS